MWSREWRHASKNRSTCEEDHQPCEWTDCGSDSQEQTFNLFCFAGRQCLASITSHPLSVYFMKVQTLTFISTLLWNVFVTLSSLTLAWSVASPSPFMPVCTDLTKPTYVEIALQQRTSFLWLRGSVALWWCNGFNSTQLSGWSLWRRQSFKLIKLSVCQHAVGGSPHQSHIDQSQGVKKHHRYHLLG